MESSIFLNKIKLTGASITSVTVAIVCVVSLVRNFQS